MTLRPDDNLRDADDFVAAINRRHMAGSTLNVRREERRLRRDPLEPLVRKLLGRRKQFLLRDDITRYVDAYAFYSLTLVRFYRAVSIGRRFTNGPHYVRKYGGKYSKQERRIATQYNKISPHLGLDLVNCLIHSRILLDRAVGLARYFLPRGERPSFTSFSDHKRFFDRRQSRGDFQDYAEYFRNETGWFEQLKLVRDKYVVHQGPKHILFTGYPFPRVDLELIIQEQNPETDGRPLARGKLPPTVISVRTLDDDIDKFLRWYCRRALRALRQQEHHGEHKWVNGVPEATQ